MKRIVTLMSALAVLSAGAQNYQVLNKLGEPLTNGTTITMGGAVGPTAGVAHLDVKNIGTESLNLMAKKIVVTSDPSQVTMFCWKYCYPPFVTNPTDTVVLLPDSVFSGFSADFISPQDVYLPIEVRYVIFKAEDPNDSISFTYRYIPSSFQMKHGNELLSSESVVEVTAPVVDEAKVEIHLQNVSNASADVLVRRTDLSPLAGAANYFCWKECYSPNVFVTPDDQFVTIEPGATTENFSGHYMANNQFGSSVTRYTFFDKRNPADSTWFLVRYTTDGTGVSDLQNNTFNCRPNPATNQVTISFNQSIADGNLNIYNLNGTLIRSIQLENGMSELGISVSDLANGVYFYTIETAGKRLAANKLVIAR